MVAAAFGSIVFAQCAQKSDEQTAQKEAEQEKIVIQEAFEKQKPEDKKLTQKDVNAEFKEAFETAVTHVDQQLDELAQNQAIKRMERTADKLDRKIIELEARLDERDLSDQAKKEMKELKAVQKDLKSQLEEVQDATADKWDDVKKDTKDAYIKSEKAIKQEVTKVEELLADNRK